MSDLSRRLSDFSLRIYAAISANGRLTARLHVTHADMELIDEAVKALRSPESPTPETRPALPFTHWSKDPLIPYDGCNCGSCAEARSVISVLTGDTSQNRESAQ